jgi:hypothetical protein
MRTKILANSKRGRVAEWFKAAVLKFTCHHTAWFYRVPDSQCFRGFPAAAGVPLSRLVPPRVSYLGSKMGSGPARNNALWGTATAARGILPWVRPAGVSAMLRLCARVIALAVMLVALPTAQAAHTTLTACKGTTTSGVED